MINEPCDEFTEPVTRLEQHAFAFRMNGLGAVARNADGQPAAEPLWTLAQLTAVERAFLGHQFDAALQRVSAWDGQQSDRRARIYAHVLASYGVACPHPVYWRRHFSPEMFECLACEHLTVGATPKRRGA